MTITAALGSESRIETYLGRVRAALRGMPDREIDDILRELRSHIVELSEGAGAEAALQSLGDPVDLAKTYRTENLLVQAECSGSPLEILQSLRHASRNRIVRVLITAAYVFGYANVMTLWIAAGHKLLAPSQTGLWYAGGAWPLRLITDGRVPSGAKELLGWWLVPVMIMVGLMLRYMIDQVALWWIRGYRRGAGLRPAHSGE
jgi:uncharacterized membrane protein